MMLHQTPAQLDGVEFRRVWRKEFHRGSFGFNTRQRLNVFMDTKVVEDDDVARMELWAELLLHKLQPTRGVQRPLKLGVAEDAVASDGADHRQVFAVAHRPRIDDTGAFLTPAITRRELCIAPGLVDEDKPRGINFLHPLREGLPLCDDVGAELLDRAVAFFFLVTPAAWRVRPIAAALTETP